MSCARNFPPRPARRVVDEKWQIPSSLLRERKGGMHGVPQARDPIVSCGRNNKSGSPLCTSARVFTIDNAPAPPNFLLFPFFRVSELSAPGCRVLAQLHRDSFRLPRPGSRAPFEQRRNHPALARCRKRRIRGAVDLLLQLRRPSRCPGKPREF